jgi:hypothetical protein
MPFSSMSDPSDLGRAYSAMEAAWEELKDGIPEARHDAERRRMAYLVACFAPMAIEEDDFKRNILDQFRQRSLQTSGV